MTSASGGVTYRRTTTDVLKAFDGDLSEVAGGVARGDYAFWLGSGISRDVAPGVPGLLRKLLAFLQQSVEPGKSGCAYRAALIEIFDEGFHRSWKYMSYACSYALFAIADEVPSMLRSVSRSNRTS